MRVLTILVVATLLLSVHCHCQPDQTKAYLNIGSTPAGGSATVDGAPAGSTPVSAFAVAPGKHVITVRKDGFVPATDTVLAVQGETIGCQLVLYPAGALLVASEPAEAAVYVDGRFSGKTPLILPELRQGQHTIMVNMPGYIRWVDYANIVAGKRDTLKARLEALLGKISVTVTGPDEEVAIDGKSMGTGSVSGHAHAMGYIPITARKRSTGDEAGGEFWLPPGGQLRLRAEFRVPTPATFRYSLLLPGLGQMLAGHVYEGGLYVAAFATAGALFINASNTYRHEVDNYDGLMSSYQRTTSKEDALRLHEVINTSFEDLRTANRQRTLYAAIAAGVYVISLADALFFHSSANRIVTIEEIGASPASGSGNPVGTGLELCVRIPL